MKAEQRRAWSLSGLLQMNWSNIVQEAALFSQPGPRAAQNPSHKKKEKTKRSATRAAAADGLLLIIAVDGDKFPAPSCVCQTGLFPNSANPPSPSARPTKTALSKYDPYAPAVVRGQLCYSRPGTGVVHELPAPVRLQLNKKLCSDAKAARVAERRPQRGREGEFCYDGSFSWLPHTDVSALSAAR